MLTKFFAKLLGLWMVLIVLSMFVNRESMATLNALLANPALVFVTGIFTMVVGIAIVISHNRWTGGPAAVLVTLYGWLALIKGCFFVLFPVPTQARFYEALHLQQYYYAYLCVALVLGGYLIYEGFRTSSGAAALGSPAAR